MSLPRPGWRDLALTVMLVGLTGVLARQLHGHYPIPTWLFWRYALAWLMAGVWALGCLSTGHEVLVRLRVTPWLRLGERVAMSFTLGALAFGLAVFALGLAGALVRPLFFLLPLGALAVGARSSWRFGRQAARHLGRARRRAGPMPWWQPPLLMAGAVAFGLLYIQVLSPDSMHFDGRWYHMPTAEHYATSGAIRPTPEAWFMGTTPQLVTYLYTWCFLHPSWQLFDRVELGLHLEVVSFLFTLAMVPTAVRRLVPRWRGRGAWPAFFLFPGIFLYDSNLSGAADHIGAIWVIPAGLCLLRALRDFEARWCALLGVFLSALALSKYSFFSVLAVPAVALPLGALYRLGQRRRAGLPLAPVVRGLAIVAGVGLVMTSPYWLKNIAFYRDPLYPMLSVKLRPSFWAADADGQMAAYNAMTWPGKPGLKGWLESLGVVFSFAFVPHDWPYFHGVVPVFGPLFTLSFFCLPLLRRTGRLWVVYLGCSLTVLLWHRIHHQDRYLQAILPWMAAATLGTFALIWRQHWLPRLGLVGLVTLQVIWSGDIPFIGTHNQIGGESPLRAAANFLQSGYKKVPNRLRIQAPWDAAGALLPRKAKVLVHESPIHLGLRSPSVNDQWQGALSYRELGSPARIYDWMKKAGVTHLAWENERSHGFDSVASDFLFFDFAVHQSVEPQRVDWLWLTKLTSERPSDEGWRDVVAVLPCGGPYAQGFYHVRDLWVQPAGGRKAPAPFAPLASRPAHETAKILDQAGYILFNGSCQPALPADITQAFPHGAWRDRDKLMIRK